MAKVGVSLKIDVSKIDKSRLFKGAKGTYLDATVFIDIDELDQYGNSGMITQDVKKEEKQQGVKGAILGNCKVFWNDGGSQQAQQQAQQRPAPQQQQQQAAYASQQQSSAQQQQQAVDDWADDLPF
mgnify:CR=1 FL=1